MRTGWQRERNNHAEISNRNLTGVIAEMFYTGNHVNICAPVMLPGAGTPPNKRRFAFYFCASQNACILSTSAATSSGAFVQFQPSLSHAA